MFIHHLPELAKVVWSLSETISECSKRQWFGLVPKGVTVVAEWPVQLKNADTSLSKHLSNEDRKNSS